MRLFLHIGTHKTGTTSIQRFADAHRTELAQRGFLYPSFELVGASHHYSHLDFAHALANGTSERLTHAQALRFAQVVRERAQEYDATLLSAEAFYRHRVRGASGAKPKYWDQKRAFVERVAEALGVADVTVVIVLRRQDRFAQSLYNENIKAARYRHSFEHFLQRSARVFAYDRQIALWARTFSRVKVMVFEDLLRKPESLEKAFLTSLGANVEGLPAIETQNESPRLDVLAYLRQLNSSRLTTTQLKVIAKLMGDAEFQARLPGPVPAFTWASVERFETLLDSVAKSNDRVRKKYAPKRSSLFPDGPVPRGDVLTELSSEQFMQMTSTLLNWLTG